MGNKKSVSNAAIAGFISGGTSKLLIYPLDTVKKRLQAQAFQSSLHSNQIKYKGMIHCFTTIAKQEGLHSFYKGMVPTVFKSIVGTGVTFAFYTFAKNILTSDDE